jgi:ribosome-associated translation inhibitor RaiA
MEPTFFQKNLSGKEEKIFIDYVKGKTGPVENLLKKFAKDAVLLKVSIEKFEKHDAYEVEFCLTLPTSNSIVAKETSHTITKAVDLSKDRLTAQIKKHMALLRKNRSHKTIRKEEVVAEKEEVEFFLNK